MAKRRVFPAKAGEVSEPPSKKQKIEREEEDEEPEKPKSKEKEKEKEKPKAKSKEEPAPKGRGKKAANGKEPEPKAEAKPSQAKSTAKGEAAKQEDKKAAASKAESSTSAPKAESSKSSKSGKGESTKPKDNKKKEKLEEDSSTSSAVGPKITRENMTTNPVRRFYQTLITPEILKDPSFKNLSSLYISSGLWDGAVQVSLEKRISEMPRLETLVLKELRHGLKLKISNANLKNFGLYARELRELELETPNLETLAIVHTLHCGTAFFADLMKQVPKLKHLNLWENFGIIQVTTVLPELETLVLSRTSATKLSCQSILENFPSLKNIYISSVDITTRTTAAWKKKFDVDVILDATRDFFFEYVVSFGDFEEPEIFHEEQKY